jgi:thioesterase domain-containing protein
MARLLREVGEEVALLVMLDTPLPFQAKLGVQDKVLMKLQDLRRHGFSFLANWIRERIRWREERRRKEKALGQEATAAQFHNARVEAAFRRALLRYELRPHPGKVLLLRPKLNIVYRISGGRFLQDGRNPALEDNGWTPYVAELEVQEVAGDHDGMVLEPFVRVLVSRLRSRLAEASPAREPFRAAAE